MKPNPSWWIHTICKLKYWRKNKCSESLQMSQFSIFDSIKHLIIYLFRKSSSFDFLISLNCMSSVYSISHTWIHHLQTITKLNKFINKMETFTKKSFRKWNVFYYIIENVKIGKWGQMKSNWNVKYCLSNWILRYQIPHFNDLKNLDFVFKYLL